MGNSSLGSTPEWKRTFKKPPRAPRGLSNRAKKVWRDANRSFVLNEAEQALIEEGLRQLDLSVTARKRVERDGPVIDMDGKTIKHPAADVSTKALAAYRMVVKDLGDLSEAVDPRRAAHARGGLRRLPPVREGQVWS